MFAQAVFGVPKELKEGENRVALTPDTVKMLTSKGYTVFIENNAGDLSGFNNASYEEAGAKISKNKEELWQNANIIIKVKEPEKIEYPLFTEKHTIFSYLHLAINPELADNLLKQKVCAISAESIVTANGEHPLMRPMSEVAGRLSIQLGAHFLEKINGGIGVLLGGVPGVQPGKVVIIGGGVVGSNAAKVAIGMGADVSVLDIDSKKLATLDLVYQGRIKTHYCNQTTISEEAKKADILVTAVSIPNQKAPKVINESIIKEMKKGSFLIDVAIDQGGNIEGEDRLTTLANPVYEKYGVLHCAIPNIPSLTPKTSSYAYSYAIYPYIKKLAEMGVFNAIRNDDEIASGVTTFKGNICNNILAQGLGLEHTELSLLVGFKVM